MATFVLVNPSVTKRAGLLATHFSSTCAHANYLQSTPNHNKYKDTNNEENEEVAKEERTELINNQVDAESLFEMIDLAHRASPMLFDFLRQCNVPLDSNDNDDNNNAN